MSIALDATYSVGRNLSGVGIYSRRILHGLAEANPESHFLFCYRPHRFLRSFLAADSGGDSLPRNASRRILRGAPQAELFHALNQRVDARATRTVATFHDLFVLTGEYSTAEFRARFAAQARAAAAASDLIIAVSEFTASQVELLLNVPRSRIRVVHHGVDLPAPAEAKREPLVLFVGAIQRRKNIARLVQAFERLPAGWRLVLAGSAEGFDAARELEAVERSPRRSAIEVLGYVPAAQLESLYRRTSIFAFPSLDEGFGMPVLEAMARGIPVLTSNRSALPEVAGDAAILADPEDQEQLGAELRRLAADESLRSELARLGRERAAALPWSKAIRKTWAVYEELGIR
jgi:glycosyltransferase involved in cell wall biosynthesis